MFSKAANSWFMSNVNKLKETGLCLNWHQMDTNAGFKSITQTVSVSESESKSVLLAKCVCTYKESDSHCGSQHTHSNNNKEDSN